MNNNPNARLWQLDREERNPKIRNLENWSRRGYIDSSSRLLTAWAACCRTWWPIECRSGRCETCHGGRPAKPEFQLRHDCSIPFSNRNSDRTSNFFPKLNRPYGRIVVRVWRVEYIQRDPTIFSRQSNPTNLHTHLDKARLSPASGWIGRLSEMWKPNENSVIYGIAWAR